MLIKKINQLYKGIPEVLASKAEVITSINKKAVEKLSIDFDSIEGDEVYNKFHHGGPNRVLHQYPSEHYLFWQKFYPHIRFSPGTMGENLCSINMTEKDVCIGDVYTVGEIRCIVTEPRKPCATINYQFQINRLAREVQIQSKTGWFYRILKKGNLKIGDEFFLEERPYPELTIEKCVQGMLVNENRGIIEMIAQNPIISENWRNPALEYLKTGLRADDRKRLGE